MPNLAEWMWANSAERMKVGSWGKSSHKADDWGRLQSLDKVKTYLLLQEVSREVYFECFSSDF